MISTTQQLKQVTSVTTLNQHIAKTNFRVTNVTTKQFIKINVPQTDAHLLDCMKILNLCQELREDNSIEFEDIYESIEVQMKVANIYKAIYKIKEKIEETVT